MCSESGDYFSVEIQKCCGLNPKITIDNSMLLINGRIVGWNVPIYEGCEVIGSRVCITDKEYENHKGPFDYQTFITCEACGRGAGASSFAGALDGWSDSFIDDYFGE